MKHIISVLVLFMAMTATAQAVELETIPGKTPPSGDTLARLKPAPTAKNVTEAVILPARLEKDDGVRNGRVGPNSGVGDCLLEWISDGDTAPDTLEVRVIAEHTNLDGTKSLREMIHQAMAGSCVVQRDKPRIVGARIERVAHHPLEGVIVVYFVYTYGY